MKRGEVQIRKENLIFSTYIFFSILTLKVNYFSLNAFAKPIYLWNLDKGPYELYVLVTDSKLSTPYSHGIDNFDG